MSAKEEGSGGFNIDFCIGQNLQTILLEGIWQYVVQAKKKAQQDKAAEKSRTKRAQAATSAAAAQPLTVRQNSMAESSESEGEEEQESVSLQDSRFASLVDDKPTPAVVIGWERAPSLGQGSQLAAPSLTHETAAGSSAADSDLEEEGELLTH